MPWQFVEMYGRMRFIDFVVSQALETNSRCLRRLATVPSEIPPVVLRKLFDDARRLNAMWALVIPEDDSKTFKTTVKRGRKLTATIGSALRGESDVALELAGKASAEKTAQSLVKLSRRLKAGEGPLQPERLWVAFQDDSSAWRELDTAGVRSDADVVKEGIGRWYRGSRSLMRQADAKTLPKTSQARACHAWCWWSAYQLELIKSELSERGKARRWYVDKLAGTLDSYLDLRNLREQAGQVDLKAAAVERLQTFLDERRRKLWKRVAKLGACAYADKNKVFVHDVQQSVERLGLDAIVILDPENRSDGRDVG